MSLRRAHYLSVALAVYGIATTAMAGIVMESAERDTKTGAERRASSIQVQNGRARIDSGADAERASTVIFRDEAVHILNAKEKSYFVIDRETVDRMANTMNDAMAKMQEQLAKMPPEQRAMMENMMKQRGMQAAPAPAKAATYEVAATGASESVAGYSCKVMNVTRDGVLTQQLCVVPYSALPGKDEFQSLIKQMTALTEKMAERTKQFAGDRNSNPTNMESSLAGKINGVPFISRRYRDGVLQPEETIVKSWKSQSIDAAQFEIPAGYAKKELPQMMNRPRQ